MTTSTTERTFLGIPIEGDITAGRRITKQRPIEELAPLLQAVLNEPGIEAFGWRQYTPYFNDGEPCIFGVGDLWFLTPEDADDEEDQKEREEDPYGWQDAHGYSGDKGFGETISKWVYTDDNDRKGTYTETPNPRYDKDRFERCYALAAAIGTGHFENALLAAFGDHAIVTITRDNITVEFYDHE